MIIIAGLGNPGEKYIKTRHNIGFMAIDQINQDYNLTTSTSSKNNITAKGKINDIDVITSKPQNYMNLSGDPILSIMSFFISQAPVGHLSAHKPQWRQTSSSLIII